MLGLPHTAKISPMLRSDDVNNQSVRYDHSDDYDFVDFRRVGSCRQAMFVISLVLHAAVVKQAFCDFLKSAFQAIAGSLCGVWEA